MTEVRCQDGCGRRASSDASAEAQGWLRLPITGRWRCPQCARALDEVNKPKDQP